MDDVVSMSSMERTDSSSFEAPQPLEWSVLGGTHATDVASRYVVTDTVLGQGAYATARLCVDRATGRRRACKSINKPRIRALGPGWADVRREAGLMLHLGDHPNIPGLIEAFEDDQDVHLVMELCEGGGLLERVMARGRYPERDAAGLVRVLLEAVAFTHDMGCAHRDIKLDNLLLADASDDPAALRLVDWGFGAFVKPGEHLKGLCGTTYYIAPEVLASTHDDKADVWSCGVVAYILLCGAPPFSGRTEAIFRRILSDGTPDMTGFPWPFISETAKSFVRAAMTWHPHRRPTARDLLQHEWLRGGAAASDCGVAASDAVAAVACAGASAASLAPLLRAPLPLPPLRVNAPPEIVKRLRRFSTLTPRERHAARVLASTLPYDNTRGLRELFNWISLPEDGRISSLDLQQALKQRGFEIDGWEAHALVMAADADGDGRLSDLEFVAATLSPRLLWPALAAVARAAASSGDEACAAVHAAQPSAATTTTTVGSGSGSGGGRSSCSGGDCVIDVGAARLDSSSPMEDAQPEAATAAAVQQSKAAAVLGGHRPGNGSGSATSSGGPGGRDSESCGSAGTVALAVGLPRLVTTA